MQQLQGTTLSIVAAACALASLGFFFSSLSPGRSNSLFSDSNHISDDDIDRSRSRRRSLVGVSDFVDPKSTDDKAISSFFVDTPAEEDEEETIIRLNLMKPSGPTIDEYRPSSPAGESRLVDVISIGCEDKLPWMVAQSQTWAASARHFWGFTERQDFDASCAFANEETTKSFVETCRSPFLGSNTFGRGHKASRAGWFCAQRRMGRSLGWLVVNYAGRSTPVPDILILVDDDTSVDIEKVKSIVPADSDAPFVAAGSMFRLGKYDGFVAAHGGFGTVFNKAAVEALMQPIFCNDDARQSESSFARNACDRLFENRAGEADLFRDGDSTFDVFFKHASRPKFCMHSDWQVGYMVQNYLGVEMEQILPMGKRHYCSEESVTCHKQTPLSMEAFAIAHPQAE